MFRKILIANRGEIAVRVIRACRELGISPVVVYSEADERSLHVRLADEAYLIGPPPSVESYLRGDRIIEAALRAGAEAIHPGYGFLAENAEFARAVEEAGLVFIGPNWQAMEQLGQKTQARALARAAGVPIVPGTEEPIRDLAHAQAIAEQVGYPVMLKAAAGGGGKGMRLVRSSDELPSALAMAQAEAQAAFKDPSVYIEKAIERPRHIEVQILADRYGHAVYLGERECSLQRRHQKVIEEAPASLNDPELRQRMGEAAVRLAQAAGYTNAGTVEFLVDEERNFYFLEVNARIQVEHPVTEMVTGVDLVREQIRLGAGEPLRLRQSEIQLRGSAIECRIYAEDPENDFFPSAGRIETLRLPFGPGIRVDSGVYAGWEVPIHYDSLLLKLIAWGDTRQQAIERMRWALEETAITGIRTTVPLYREIFRDPDFLAGRIDTGYLARFLAARRTAPYSEEDLLSRDAALIAAALFAASKRESREPAQTTPTSVWKWQGRLFQLASRL
ncbi:MAG: acetyl-CoA carboxylase biotin carboxylase subunit [Blastocatellia bacterium]|nr:acetyl-CoA carboxylase biotin carboxylase subunit [Blastocatellia bacterium]MCS7158572.1 acetyl-CoA carboxylase biotin carboxylase subunit [Blastocatellia bacterium]MDW8169302.1 acetyl-CoA carboxylase biotin carboxylase subunit [Acidobacteriota bacterium]MDW8257768.1 acetyl-CoA carboxylase biotin carboxylase subunit [Acidobacteriota bacterium]